MRYEITDYLNSTQNPTLIRLILDPHDESHSILYTIAKHSYETALPRGLGEKQPHDIEGNDVDFREYFLNMDISNFSGRAMDRPMLLMDYINGRDCRTKVYYGKDGSWYFDAYAFEQRQIDPERFFRGEREVHASEFLDQVIGILGEKIDCPGDSHE